MITANVSSVNDANRQLQVRPALTEVYSRSWVERSYDHNHLRITRIIRSLRVLGLEDEAQAFYKYISLLMESIKQWDLPGPSENSIMYWNRAATRPLNLAPADEDTSNPRFGLAFLWKYEMKKAKEAAETGEAAAAAEAPELDEDEEDEEDEEFDDEGPL